jgi:hypothetical protein
MQAPMAGVWHVIVRAAQAYQIHGDLYYEIAVVREDDPQQQVIAVRLPQFTVGQQPQMGEKMTLTFLMGQITSAIRR